MNSLRRHLNYANVVATLALVFAMSGGALAASHYLINSTKQINPKVLKKLKGNAGKTGPTGPQGANGAAGGTGPPGSKGATGAAGLSALSVLPSGQTETGDYGIRTPGGKSGEFMDESVTFPIPLEEPAPKTHVVYTTTSVPVTHCPGPGQAERGYLCIYSGNSGGVKTPPNVESFEGHFPTEGSGRFGFNMEWSLTAAEGFDIGTYTVTAG